jgi:DNA-binding transcriptional LysR family regulator
MRELPSLKQLEYFVALAETRSFRGAAERCGISQPSLSVQLSNLEKRLGQKLVERARSGVILTAAGREVQDRAREVLVAAQNLVSRFDTPRKGLVGTIRFGASPTLGPYLLPHVIGRLHALHPELSLFIREAPPEELTAGLARGDFDMVLVQLPVRGDFIPREAPCVASSSPGSGSSRPSAIPQPRSRPRLRAGRSGIVFAPDYAEHGFRSQVHGQPQIVLEDHIDKRDLRFMGDGAAYNFIAMEQAVADSGLTEAEVPTNAPASSWGRAGRPPKPSSRRTTSCAKGQPQADRAPSA